jgi:hypothetical protein
MSNKIGNGEINSHCDCGDIWCECVKNQLRIFDDMSKPFWDKIVKGFRGTVWVDGRRITLQEIHNVTMLVDHLTGNESSFRLTYTVWENRLGLTVYSHDCPTGCITMVHPAEYVTCAYCDEIHLVPDIWSNETPSYRQFGDKIYCYNRYQDCSYIEMPIGSL